MTIVERIVGQLHVGASDLEVCRVLYFRFSKAARRSPWLREERKECYRNGIKTHRENRAMHDFVMRGLI